MGALFGGDHFFFDRSTCLTLYVGFGLVTSEPEACRPCIPLCKRRRLENDQLCKSFKDDLAKKKLRASRQGSSSSVVNEFCRRSATKSSGLLATREKGVSGHYLPVVVGFSEAACGIPRALSAGALCLTPLNREVGVGFTCPQAGTQVA